MRKVLLFALCCAAMPNAANAANVVLNFQGSTNNRTVTGSLTYDPDAMPDFVDSYNGYNVAQYFPNSQLSFTSNGFTASDFYRLAVADAYAPNEVGATDAFLGSVIRGGSGREQFGVDFNYNDLTTLSSTQLLANFPTTAGITGSFFYNYAGEGYTVPITFSYGAVIGSVPEPTTWAMMILGMGMIGCAIRRRIRVSNVTFTSKVRA